MAIWWKAGFCTLIAAQASWSHAQVTHTATHAQVAAPAASATCITRAAMRAALEEIMPPRPRVIPPPGMGMLPRPTDADCATIDHLKTSLRLAQRKRW